MKILIIFFGGGLGAVSRFLTSLFAVKLFGSAFPVGTIIVNLCGCFLIGLINGFAEHREFISPNFRFFFITGFLGALTTFSTFGFESLNFFLNNMNRLAIINIAINNIAGLGLVFVGLWLGRII